MFWSQRLCLSNLRLETEVLVWLAKIGENQSNVACFTIDALLVQSQKLFLSVTDIPALKPGSHILAAMRRVCELQWSGRR